MESAARRPLGHLTSNVPRPTSHVLLIGSLAAAVFLILLPCLKADFIYWDDDQHVFANPDTASLSGENLRKIFTSTVNDTYIPLSILSYAVERHFFGLFPYHYHADNVLLHIANVLLVFFLAGRLGLGTTAAFLAALLFGIHPMHVESVAWVTSRKDVLYTFFYLLSVLCYHEHLKTGCRKKYWLSLGFGVLSVLAKPMALSLPFILALLNWFIEGTDRRRTLRSIFPFTLLIFSIVSITYGLNARTPMAQFPQSLLLWIWCASFYVEKFFLPIGLSPLYRAPQPVDLANPFYLKGLLIVVFITLALIRFRRERLLVFAVAWYALSTFFLWRFDLKDTSLVADRFMYLPSLGFCLWIGNGLEKLSSKSGQQQTEWRRPLLWLALTLFLLLPPLTVRQCRVWSNDWTFWNEVIRRLPDSSLAYTNRGVFLQLMGADALALADLNQAVALDPSNFVAYLTRGKLFGKEGQWELAREDYDRALEQPLNEKTYLAYFNRGLAYQALGRRREALRDFEQTISLKPDYPEGFARRMDVLNILQK